MATYVTLVRWTEQGVKTVKDLPARLEAAGKLMEAGGGRFVATYMTMGEYDLVVVSEGQSDEAAAAAALTIAKGGNVRTTTMRAFTGPEIAAIVAKVP